MYDVRFMGKVNHMMDITIFAHLPYIGGLKQQNEY